MRFCQEYDISSGKQPRQLIDRGRKIAKVSFRSTVRTDQPIITGRQMSDSNSAFPNAFALIIAIADYTNIRKLPRVDDGRDVAALLTDPAQCGYLPGNVRKLIDGEATGDAIRRELSHLADSCNKDSTVLVYFSGHGGKVQTGPQAGEYLLPVDTVYPSDEELARTALASTEFTKLLNQIPARKSLIIFDCCHAGGLGETRDLRLGSQMKPGLSAGFFDALAGGGGRAILASCRADEVSYVLPGARYGLFTEHLLKGLRGAAASEDGVIRVFDLFEYVQPRVTEIQPGQHPYFKFAGDQNLPIALYRGGIKGEIARVEGDFIYDAYLSYADVEPDATFIWNTLLPKLRAAGLKVAVSNDCEEPGVDRVVNRERGIERSKRTIVALSNAFLDDHWAAFDETAATTLGIEEGKYRLLPITIGPVSTTSLPLRIRRLTTLDMTSSGDRFERASNRLIDALRQPIPTRGGQR